MPNHHKKGEIITITVSLLRRADGWLPISVIDDEFNKNRVYISNRIVVNALNGTLANAEQIAGIIKRQDEPWYKWAKKQAHSGYRKPRSSLPKNTWEYKFAIWLQVAKTRRRRPGTGAPQFARTKCNWQERCRRMAARHKEIVNYECDNRQWHTWASTVAANNRRRGEVRRERQDNHGEAEKINRTPGLSMRPYWMASDTSNGQPGPYNAD